MECNFAILVLLQQVDDFSVDFGHFLLINVKKGHYLQLGEVLDSIIVAERSLLEKS